MKKQPNFIIGLENYKGTEWSNSFYPSDLPEDWFLDYYTNEFSLLMLDKEISSEDSSISFVSQLSESFCEDFELFLPLGYQSTFDKTIHQLVASGDELDEIRTYYFNEFLPITQGEFNELYLDKFYDILNYQVIKQKLLITVNCQTILEPKELKLIIDCCLELNLCTQSNDNYVFFSDSIHAITNANNLTLLSQMI